MGLLVPISGQLLPDGIDLYSNSNDLVIRNFTRNILHVPQEIYLEDCSILENISSCRDIDRIDLDKLHYSLKISHLHQYVESLLLGLSTRAGERGTLLSGGQRQRVLLARAVYKSRPENILFLDKATSALDPMTETIVFRNLKELTGNLSIVVVTHNTHFLDVFDFVYRLAWFQKTFSLF